MSGILSSVVLLSPLARHDDMLLVLCLTDMARSNKNNMTSRLIFTRLIVLALCLCGFPAVAQQSNPFESDPRAPYAGGVIFRAQCATCHGADAKGISSIDAPDLTQMWSGRELSDSDVFQTIRNGVAGSIMPPHGFPDPEVWMLVSYLKSIAVSGTNRVLTGDSNRGNDLFAANCRQCHRVAGKGGSLGPDLTQITARRSYAALVESVRNPGAMIGGRYKPVSVILVNGEKLQGTIKSEDAFSMQIMDSNQQLRGLDKQSIRVIDREIGSLMPQFSTSALSDSDLDNILTYLQSQRWILCKQQNHPKATKLKLICKAGFG